MKHRVFLLTYLVYAGSYLCRKNLAVSMPVFGPELGFDEFALARILFCYSLLYAFGQFAHGIFADKFGPKIVVGFGLSWAIAANLGMGVMSALGPFVFLAGLNGFGQASGWPGLAKNLTYWYKPSERGVVMAWWQTNYILGGLAATLVATLILSHFGWRRAFLVPPLILLGIVALYLALCPAQPDKDRSGLDARKPKERARLFSQLRELIKNPMLWVIGLMYFLLKMILYCFIYWLPLYMTQQLAYSPRQAGLTSGLLELAGFLGALAAGYASDRLFAARRMPVGALMLWGLALALLCFPYLSASGQWGNGLAIALGGFLAFGPESLLAGSASLDLGSNEQAGGAAGFVNGLGSLGMVLSPFLAAYAASGFGWDKLFFLFAAAAALAGIVLARRWNYLGTPHSTKE